jgi:predicted metal-dependent peptidase
MSDEEVTQCYTEFAEIMKQCGAKKLFLILHDACVFYAGEVQVEALTNLRMSRGGTSHREVFELLAGEVVTNPHGTFELPKEAEIELVVLFTDLGTDFTDRRPKYECIWAVPSDGCPGPSESVPFGKKVTVDMKSMRKKRSS